MAPTHTLALALLSSEMCSAMQLLKLWVAAPEADMGGINRGTLYIMQLRRSDGRAVGLSEISSSTVPALNGLTMNNAALGQAMALLGDANGDV